MTANYTCWCTYWLAYQIQMSCHYFIGMILMLSCDATHLIELPKAKSQSGNYIGNTWTSGNLPMAGSCVRSEFSNWRTFCCYPSRNYIHIPLYAILSTLFFKSIYALSCIGSKKATFITERESDMMSLRTTSYVLFDSSDMKSMPL